MVSMPIVARRLIIRGFVQGIGYRWSMMQAATRQGLVGWVRNRRDGSVEALLRGPQDAVAAMIHWASKGPAGARVEVVEVEDCPEGLSEALHDFAQRSTI